MILLKIFYLFSFGKYKFKKSIETFSEQNTKVYSYVLEIQD